MLPGAPSRGPGLPAPWRRSSRQPGAAAWGWRAARASKPAPPSFRQQTSEGSACTAAGELWRCTNKSAQLLHAEPSLLPGPHEHVRRAPGACLPIPWRSLTHAPTSYVTWNAKALPTTTCQGPPKRLSNPSLIICSHRRGATVFHPCQVCRCLGRLVMVLPQFVLGVVDWEAGAATPHLRALLQVDRVPLAGGDAHVHRLRLHVRSAIRGRHQRVLGHPAGERTAVGGGATKPAGRHRRF